MKAARHFVAVTLPIIVIALTNLGFAWTILGCAPGVVHVASADAMAFQQLLDVETSADARRPAHLMGQWVRGGSSGKVGILEDEKLPEAYTNNGRSGVWRSHYHLGYAALRIVRAYYAAAHPTHQMLEDGNLVEIVDKAGGNLEFIHDFNKDLQPDIADVDGRFLFEIVPPGQAHQEAGKKKIDWQVRLLNYAMIDVPTFKLGTGYQGEIGVRFAEGAAPWKLTWQTTDPGVVQYQWQALSVDGATEDAYRQAYLDNRWHEPTPNEVVRLGGALHEVVERLVQAREALGQTRAATTMPMLPGKTVADYLRSVALWSAHDDDVARLLPVMRQPPPPPVQVRRDARLFGQTIGGGGGGGPQGGYTVKGRPGNQPWNLHMGNAAHNVIGMQYKTTHVSDKVRTNTVSILEIVKAARGTLALLRADEALLRPDITDLDAHVVFEIKSSAKGQLDVGKTIVARNIAAINRAMGATGQFKHGTGFAGDFWVRFDLSMRYWRLKWSTTAPGVVQYNWSKLNDDEVDEAQIMKGIQEGRYTWVNLTAADMERYAEKCERFSQMYAVGAQKLHTIQMVTDLVVGIIGNATIIYLSPGLAPGKTAQPGAVPVVRPTAPRMAPNTPGPKSPPPVNAPSLGSDTRATFTGSVHPTPRPAAPGKTPSGPKNVSPN